jgi:hypothetical protein
MWSEDFEVVGARFWDRLLAGSGIGNDRDRNKPGLVFRYEELSEIILFLILIMLFQWDATLVDGDGHLMIHISHNEYVRFSAREETAARAFAKIANAWNKA